MAGCTFCDILAGRLPASIVYRGEHCSAFMDIHPLNQGHVLVVPNLHAAHLADLDPETGAHMFVLAQRLAAAVRASGIPCQGVSLTLADGAAAGQEVFHVHLHVVPRLRGDGLGWRRYGPGDTRRPSRADLDGGAALIRDALSP